MILIDGEAICAQCGAKARCTLDIDLLLSRRIASPGAAMHGLPSWYYKDASGGNLFCSPNLACSEKCASKLEKETSYAGKWISCAVVRAPIG